MRWWILVLLIGSVMKGGGAEAKEWLTADQKRRAEQLTSLFENGTIELQYGYCEALGDGRGYTAGRGGFTSADGEIYEIAKSYLEQKPGGALVGYLPRLKELAKEEDGSVKGLKGLAKAWREAAKDPIFRHIQDGYVEERFLAPVLQHCANLGLKTPLAKAAVYDTMIQHGSDGDEDGLPALLKKTKAEVGGTPATGVDEKKWLEAFLKVRRADLAQAANKETREEWAMSVGRCDVLLELAKAGNYDLKGPIEVHTGDFKGVIP
ncbi:chitosanase [soil metagenome]